MTVHTRRSSGLGNAGVDDTWRAAYGDAHFKRLRQAKRRYDPHNLFRLNHNIPPAEAQEMWVESLSWICDRRQHRVRTRQTIQQRTDKANIRKPALPKQMIANLGASVEHLMLSASHTVMLSKPRELAAISNNLSPSGLSGHVE